MQIILRLQNDPCADGLVLDVAVVPEVKTLLVLPGYHVGISWHHQCDLDRGNPPGATEADYDERRPVAFEVASVGHSFDPENKMALLPCCYLKAIPTKVSPPVDE